MVSSTSRSANSNALAVSFSVPRSALRLIVSFTTAVSMLKWLRFPAADVSFSSPGLAVFVPGSPLITPVDCQVGALSHIRYPSTGVALRSTRESAAGELRLTGEVVPGVKWDTFPRSCFAFELPLAIRLVMPPRCLRMSSTLCIPSGFFRKMNWSRCLPSEDEVKFW